MEIDLGELSIVEVKLSDKGKLKARVKWTFSSGAEIRGGRIMISEKFPGQLWVQLPKYRSKSGQWNNIIVLRPDHLKELEEKAKKEYERAISCDIDLEEIDF